MGKREFAWLAFIALTVLLSGATLAAAQDPSSSASPTTSKLPRSFQQARLGMAAGELLRLVPETVKGAPRPKPQQSVTVPSGDPHVRQIEYRLHQGTLYEIVVHYRADRVPRGYAGLRTRLTELYGPPAHEGLDDFDLYSGILSSRRMEWNDGVTRITVTERQRLREAREETELFLTMTDLSVERLHEQQQRERRRQEELRVPVPLPDQPPVPERTADPARRSPRPVAEG
ncbi:hypothetical protein [Nitrospira sp. Kam-Ns4a]